MSESRGFYRSSPEIDDKVYLSRSGEAEAFLTAETLDVRDSLGRTTALETLQCALCLVEIRSTFLKLGTIDLGALVETGILDRGCRRDSERHSQAQMFVSKATGNGVAQGEQP